MTGNFHQLEGHALSDHKWELEYLGIGDSHYTYEFPWGKEVCMHTPRKQGYMHIICFPQKFIRVYDSSWKSGLSGFHCRHTHTHTHTHTLTPNSTHTIITQLCVSMPPGWVRHAASRCGLHDIDCGVCVCARMRACVWRS